MRRFCIVVTRVGRRWRIDIPELRVYTHARLLAEIVPIARAFIAERLALPVDEVIVSWRENPFPSAALNP